MSPAARSEDGYDIGSVQELLGHKDIKTIMIYSDVLNRGPGAVRSPVDRLLIPVRPRKIDCETTQPNIAVYGSGQPRNLLTIQGHRTESRPVTEKYVAAKRSV